MNRSEVKNTIENILIPFADCIAWEDFSDRGNTCYDPYSFSSSAEEEEEAYTFAAVLLEMPKGSQLAENLAKKVTNQLANNWITYPWLAKAVSRLLSKATYIELETMVKLSIEVKNAMRAKGITQITSIKEVLS